jgi:hypothetical protein
MKHYRLTFYLTIPDVERLNPVALCNALFASIARKYHGTGFSLTSPTITRIKELPK